MARVSGVTVESNPLDNEVHFPINVDTLPVFLIDEITMLEGTDTINGVAGITAKLDTPAPRDMEINFSVTPINGDENNDCVSSLPVFLLQGPDRCVSRVFYGDSTPELTEQFRMDFTADQHHPGSHANHRDAAE